MNFKVTITWLNKGKVYKHEIDDVLKIEKAVHATSGCKQDNNILKVTCESINNNSTWNLKNILNIDIVPNHRWGEPDNVI